MQYGPDGSPKGVTCVLRVPLRKMGSQCWTTRGVAGSRESKKRSKCLVMYLRSAQEYMLGTLQELSGVSGCAGVGCSTTGVQNVQMPQQCGMHSVPPTYMGSPANPLLGQQSGSIANEALLPGMMGPSLTAVAQNMQGQSLVDFIVRQMQEMIARLSPLQAQAGARCT